MPKKKPITLNDAHRLLEQAMEKAFKEEQFHEHPGGYNWYEDHFVFWISEIGYHIDITGDEFEPLVISSKVS